MPKVQLRANLGSSDFPDPLCEFKEDGEYEVSDFWAAKLVAQQLAVIVEQPAAVVAVLKPVPIAELEPEPVVESKQEQPVVSAPQPVTHVKKSKEK